MATGFHEIRFPTDISNGAVFGPEFSTDIVKMSSDAEQRNQNWAYPRHKGDVAHGVKTQAELDKLKIFYYNRCGRAYGFRYKDHADYQAKAQLIGTGNGAMTTFQLTKKYVDDGGFSKTRIIKKPVAGTVYVYVAGQFQSSGVTIDTTTGIVTFAAAPTGAITADFEFDVPVRFDSDYMPISMESINLYSWSNIPIIELR